MRVPETKPGSSVGAAVLLTSEPFLPGLLIIIGSMKINQNKKWKTIALDFCWNRGRVLVTSKEDEPLINCPLSSQLQQTNTPGSEGCTVLREETTVLGKPMVPW